MGVLKYHKSWSCGPLREAPVVSRKRRQIVVESVEGFIRNMPIAIDGWVYDVHKINRETKTLTISPHIIDGKHYRRTT